MKKIILGIAATVLLGGAIAYAQAPGYWGQGGPGWGPGMMGPGWGQGMGPGMMRGYYGPYGSPDYGPAEAISLDQAKEIAKQYT
ncbi:MAG TPA: hypothetical protein VMT22_23460, partial [Terriglobales bacterium]|nr:hypothetical protein [Terriglobales bacterium]